MQKINILFVVTQLELGGAQKQLLSLIRRMDPERYNVFLFTAREGKLKEEALSIPGLKVHFSEYLQRSIHPLKDLLALGEMAGFIKKHGIDIVHTHSSKAGILGRWAGALAKARIIIHTVHGWSFNDFQRPPVRQLYTALERFTAKFTDKIIVVSEHDRQKGSDLKIGSKDRYALVRYGIERARFGVKDPSVRKELGIDPDALVIGTVACFKPQKAPEDFIRLAAEIHRALPQARFLMVGDGALRKKIEERIAECDLAPHVMLLGWRQDIPRILSAMDIFALTSLWEGLPIAVLEAMVNGVPVVATHTGGISEVITEGETGFLVPCHDMASMLNKALILLQDASVRDRVIQSAKRRIDAIFDTGTLVKAHDDLYQELIEAKGRVHVH